MKKQKVMRMVGGGLIVIAVVAVGAIVVHNMTAVTSTGSVTLSGGETMVGLQCQDTSSIHPVFEKSKPVSFTNTITANFVDDNLSSIMYRYEGVYASSEEASKEREIAEIKYNSILGREYNTDIKIFSHSFMVDGEKLGLTITAEAGKVTSRTAPYFFLDDTKAFPKTINSMKNAFKEKGFSCTNRNKDI